eukprot:3331439-Amphidinium_carterae.1
MDMTLSFRYNPKAYRVSAPVASSRAPWLSSSSRQRLTGNSMGFLAQCILGGSSYGIVRRMSAQQSAATRTAMEGQAFYINLARRRDRREKLLKVFDAAGSALLKNAVRIDAIDGEKLALHFHSGTVWMAVDPEAVAKGARAERNG